MKIIKILLITCIAVGTLSASKCKEKSPDLDKCGNIGEVVDLTGLDGCGLVIELKDEKLEPMSWPDHYTPQAGDKIAFDFTEVDGASICMVGKIVKVTCAKKL